MPSDVGLLRMYAEVLHVYTAILQVYVGPLQRYAAPLQVYTAIFRVHTGPLSRHVSVLHVYTGSLQVHVASLRLNVGLLQRCAAALRGLCTKSRKVVGECGDLVTLVISDTDSKLIWCSVDFIPAPAPKPERLCP